MQEKTLSQKAWKGETGAFKGKVFLIKDVQEFLKDLKEEIKEWEYDDYKTEEMIKSDIIFLINWLAGSDLTK